LDIKPLVFGTFGEMSSNVKEVVNIAVEYGVEHLGRTMAATTVDGVRTSLRRRYKTQMSLAV
jgi:CO dehydrogenase nickel-insertion accessory protein CooC1